ncbi:glycosyltransferase family 2 protein [Parapedobacter deserti]|uniref:Glycosyltransferase family 2 protein n=1 Tax=Parapedobacter deserti TaxID=1912957 RepID=A0ABV7JRY7_9SPHI
METRISVVIPTYRRPRLLVKCLEALHGQTLEEKAFEVIVVSDGPDAATADAVARWHAGRADAKFRFISTSIKKGPAAARNAGWRAAEGQLIAFTDDDCLPHPEWLETLVHHFGGQPHFAMTGYVQVPIPQRPTDFEWNTAQLQTAEFVTANCCCTKDALTAVGGFDERFGMAWREDSDLQFKFISCGIPVVHVSNAVVKHPVRQAPWGISLKEQKKGLYNALLYKKYPRLYREKIQKHPAWQYYITVSLFLALCITLFLGFRTVTEVAFLGWLLCVGGFAWKRLRDKDKSVRHVTEMVFTSLFIPFLSIYWQCYGAFKYRVLLL